MRCGSDGSVDKRFKEVAKNIFETEGVKRILEADAEKFSASKEMVMGHLHRIATSQLSADSNKVRAAGQLSKMVDGWQDGDKGKNPVAVLNFLAQIVGGNGQSNGASSNGMRDVTPELPPGGNTIVDAEEFFAERDEDVALVVDEPTMTRALPSEQMPGVSLRTKTG